MNSKNSIRPTAPHPARAPSHRPSSNDLTSNGFADLGLIDPLLRAIRHEGHEQPTPIQEGAIPHVLAGKDLIGCAQTGTGKTAAFVLPILQQLVQQPAAPARQRPVRVLVLSPTRELASQIARGFERYGRYTDIRQAVIFGGVGQQPQVDALRRGVDVLVATPGRLCDLIAQGLVQLSRVGFFVLDEADRMLDDGFLPAVRRIMAKIPRERQTLLFSATFPAEIEPLAQQALVDPVRVEVAPTASTPDAVEQALYFVDQRDKRALLHDLLGDDAVTRAIVFTRTKHRADRVARQLVNGAIHAAAIHGDKAQGARERALERFRTGSLRVLVATDIAARGIDVEGISHVINYDLPNDPEAYVHRIGRTARAGMQGIAVSFCSVDEHPRLASIERLTRRRVPVIADHAYPSPESTPAPETRQPFGAPAAPRGHGAGRRSRGGGGRRRR